MRRKLPKFARGRTAQQTLPHVYAQKSVFALTVAFLVLALLMLTTGAAVIAYSDTIVELSLRYDHIHAYRYSVDEVASDTTTTTRPHRFVFNGSTYASGVRTRVSFTLPRSVTAPVYLQYRLTGYYQNYRMFGASFDSEQAMHYRDAATRMPQGLCSPFRYPGEYTGVQGVAGYYSPCGALAWSLFNDSFALYRAASASGNDTLICDGAARDDDNSNSACHKRGIAFASDMRGRFLPAVDADANSGPVWRHGGDARASNPYLREGYYYGEPGHVIPATDDEDFVVWANIAYLSDFHKLYRVIDVALPAGDYFVDVVEQYPTHAFGGKKYVELVTRSWMGGRNYVLGVMLTSVGAAAAVVVVSLHLLRACDVAPLIAGE